MDTGFSCGEKMKNITKVLLASHGTPGAIAAEDMALQMCPAGGQLYHLIVVPTLWQGMTGDDWLNNGVTRDRFRRYLEGELGREVDEHVDRVRRQAEALGIEYQNEIVVGEPDECLLQTTSRHAFDLVVMGSRRPKGVQGLRSRMLTDKTRALSSPVLVMPYLHEQYDNAAGG
jgi:nucleotide-binding universal stress UspA family protein